MKLPLSFVLSSGILRLPTTVKMPVTQGLMEHMHTQDASRRPAPTYISIYIHTPFTLPKHPYGMNGMLGARAKSTTCWCRCSSSTRSCGASLF